MIRRLVSLALIPAALVACDAEVVDEVGDQADDSFLVGGKHETLFGLAEGSPRARGLLRLVNEASYSLLDDPVADGGIGLNSIAASNIVAARERGSIESLGALDTISYVGESAFSALVTYARDNTYFPHQEEESFGSRDSNGSMGYAESIGNARTIRGVAQFEGTDDEWYQFRVEHRFSFGAHLADFSADICPSGYAEHPCSPPNQIGTLHLVNASGLTIASDKSDKTFPGSGRYCAGIEPALDAPLQDLPPGTYYVYLEAEDVGWGFDCPGSSAYRIELAIGAPVE